MSQPFANDGSTEVCYPCLTLRPERAAGNPAGGPGWPRSGLPAPLAPWVFYPQMTQITADEKEPICGNRRNLRM